MSKPVRLYMSPNCTSEALIRLILSEHGVRPEVIFVVSDDGRKKLEKLAGTAATPQIFIGDHHIGGYQQLRKKQTSNSLASLLEDD